jgi:hypothetical protein
VLASPRGDQAGLVADDSEREDLRAVTAGLILGADTALGSS